MTVKIAYNGYSFGVSKDNKSVGEFPIAFLQNHPDPVFKNLTVGTKNTGLIEAASRRLGHYFAQAGNESPGPKVNNRFMSEISAAATPTAAP